ncbi:MAG TPA: hypothetical protein PK850_08590 [Ignavibacteria bacterium]|nr:hypothetical protein [Bacteroidota bacterium]HRF66004.1 hypothetical protein [Ignavibacteria bacterium]
MNQDKQNRRIQIRRAVSGQTIPGALNRVVVICSNEISSQFRKTINAVTAGRKIQTANFKR